jgi:hypothetical protein
VLFWGTSATGLSGCSRGLVSCFSRTSNFAVAQGAVPTFVAVLGTSTVSDEMASADENHVWPQEVHSSWNPNVNDVRQLVQKYHNLKVLVHYVITVHIRHRYVPNPINDMYASTVISHWCTQLLMNTIEFIIIIEPSTHFTEIINNCYISTVNDHKIRANSVFSRISWLKTSSFLICGQVILAPNLSWLLIIIKSNKLLILQSTLQRARTTKLDI